MLDIAVPQMTGFIASGIEECRCPRGYGGLSCQDCEFGFYRDRADRSNGPLGRCKPCECGGNEQVSAGGKCGFLHKMCSKLNHFDFFLFLIAELPSGR